MTRAKAFEAVTIRHGMELSKDDVKVTVGEVIMSYVVVPMPTDDVYTMAHAFQCFLTWPRD